MKRVRASSQAIALLLALGSITAGCGAELGIPSSQAAPPSSNPWLAEDELGRAVAFRQKVGLRADMDWIRNVAAMPEAAAGVLAYNVPLTVTEVATLKQRAAELHAVLNVVDQYGAMHPDEWGGSSQDTRIGAAAARFTDNLEQHEAALRAKLEPNVRLIMLKVRWSLADLEIVVQRIHDDWNGSDSWLKANRIYLLGLGVDVSLNQVELEASSARTDLDVLLEDHFDAIDKVAVTSDGTGVRFLPKGTLRGRVVDSDGRPVSGATVELAASIAGAGPHGDVGHGTNANGEFLFEDITAVTYTVFVFSGLEVDTRTLLASAQVNVVADKTTRVTVIAP